MSETKSTPPPDPRSRRTRRLKRAGMWSGGALLLYTLFGFFIVPVIILKAVVPGINDRLNGTLTLADAHTNPFTFECILDGLELKDSRGVRTFAFDRFEGNLQTWPTIFTRGYHFERAIVVNPFVRAEVLKERRFNFETLLKQPAAPGTPPEPFERIPRVRIQRISVQGGGLLLRDESLARPYEEEWDGLNVEITPFDWDPAHKSPIRIVASTEHGEKLELSATVLSEPTTLEGDVKLSALRLAAFMPYLEQYAQGEVIDGRLAADLSFRFAPAAQPPVASAHLKSATVEGLKLTQRKAGGEEFFSFQRLTVTDAKADAVARALSVAEVLIEQPSAVLERASDGRLNVEQALGLQERDPEVGAGLTLPYPIEAARDGVRNFVSSRPRTDPGAITFPIQRILSAMRNLIEDMGQGWEVDVERAMSRGSSVRWIDRSVQPVAELRISDANTTLGPIRRRDDWLTPVTVSAKIGENGAVDLAGSVSPVHHTIDLQVKLTSFDLAPAASYEIPPPAQGWTAMRLAGGTISVDGRVKASMDGNGNATAEWSGALGAAEMRVNDASSVPVLSFATLSLEGQPRARTGSDGSASATWSGRAQVRSLAVDLPLAGPVKATLDSMRIEGAAATDLNQTLSAKYEGVVELSGLNGVALDLGVTSAGLGALAIEGTAAASTGEQRTTASFRGEISGGSASIQLPSKGLDQSALRSISLKGDADFQFGGQGAALTWTGDADIAALRVEGPLAGPVAAGVEAITHRGEVQVALPADRAADVVLAGEATIVNADVRAPELAESHATIASAQVKGIDARLAARSVTIDSIVARGPVIEANTTLVKQGDPTGADSGVRDPGVGVTLPFALKLNSLKSSEGSARIVDRSGGAPTEIVADALAIDISGVDSTGAAPATLSVASNVTGSGRFELAGTINAFSPQIAADLLLKIRTLPLKPYDPYAARFIGYEIDRGRMNIAIPVKVEQRKVTGKVDFDFDALYLGRSVPSPDAPDIPIKLGLALLRDSHDHVNGEVSFSGDMTDPKYSLSGVIWQAFFGLITKAATAPFQLLAAAFGGGEDLSFVAFEPGTDVITDASFSKIDSLGKALTDRPTLNLRIVTPDTSPVDAPALRLLILREQCLAALRGRDPTAANLTALSDQQYLTELAAAYRAHLLNTNQPVPAPEAVPERSAMESALAEFIEVPPDRMIALAEARAARVVGLLTGEAGIAPERIETAKSGGTPKSVKEPRVEFDLDTK